MWLDGLLYGFSFYGLDMELEFNRPEWIDEAVKQFTLCHQHTYDTKTGLYYHAWNEDRSQRWLIRKQAILLISGDVVLVGGLWLW